MYLFRKLLLARNRSSFIKCSDYSSSNKILQKKKHINNENIETKSPVSNTEKWTHFSPINI